MVKFPSIPSSASLVDEVEESVPGLKRRMMDNSDLAELYANIPTDPEVLKRGVREVEGRDGPAPEAS
jgi:hypothetical protein